MYTYQISPGQDCISSIVGHIEYSDMGFFSYREVLVGEVGSGLFSAITNFICNCSIKKEPSYL